jgi:dihydrolipoamide dehydrogenase
MPKRLVVLGGGPGGYVAALRAAQLGASVTVVEARGLGGTCLHRGCIPTKALVATAGVLTTVQRAKEFGVRVADQGAVDLREVVSRKNRIVHAQAQGIEQLFRAAKVTLIRGTGTLTGPRSVAVQEPDGRMQTVEGDGLIVATGSEPARPALFPFDGERVMTSDDLLDLAQLPASLVIVGGGVTGCEFAGIFRTFGTNVTIVEQLPRLVASEDEAVSALLLREMKRRGIRVALGTTVAAVEPPRTACGSRSQPARRWRLSGAGRGRAVAQQPGHRSRDRRSSRRSARRTRRRRAHGTRRRRRVGDRRRDGPQAVGARGLRRGGGRRRAGDGGQVAIAADRIPAGIFTVPEIGAGLTESQARATDGR